MRTHMRLHRAPVCKTGNNMLNHSGLRHCEARLQCLVSASLAPGLDTIPQNAGFFLWGTAGKMADPPNCIATDMVSTGAFTSTGLHVSWHRHRHVAGIFHTGQIPQGKIKFL